jgi:hypothetical protein
MTATRGLAPSQLPPITSKPSSSGSDAPTSAHANIRQVTP